VHDDHQRRGREAAELPVDGLADRQRLRAGGFPAGAGEGVLDLGREDAEADGDDRPEDGDGLEVGGGPAAEAADGSVGVR
jgi:hypothetical protein